MKGILSTDGIERWPRGNKDKYALGVEVSGSGLQLDWSKVMVMNGVTCPRVSYTPDRITATDRVAIESLSMVMNLQWPELFPKLTGISSGPSGKTRLRKLYAEMDGFPEVHQRAFELDMHHRRVEILTMVIEMQMQPASFTGIAPPAWLQSSRTRY